MNVMSDTLPQSNTSPSPPPPGAPPQPTGSMGKETGPHISFVETPLMQEVGQETPLSNEVAKAGVTIQPTSVTMPPSVQELGVKVVGSSSPAVSVASPAVTLPLSDDQIARGLHQSIMSSWRWLAVWCVRQLKQAHVMLKTFHGKITRSNT